MNSIMLFPILYGSDYRLDTYVQCLWDEHDEGGKGTQEDFNPNEMV